MNALQALQQIEAMPFSMVNDSESLRQTIRGIQELARSAIRSHNDRAESAQTVAHELFARECFAFTGESLKPHSHQCQQAAQRLGEWCVTLTASATPALLPWIGKVSLDLRKDSLSDGDDFIAVVGQMRSQMVGKPIGRVAIIFPDASGSYDHAAKIVDAINAAITGADNKNMQQNEALEGGV